MKNIFNSLKQTIMKKEKQNEPIVKDEEKKSLEENELKEVNGGILPDCVDPKDPLNKLGRDPRNKSKIPSHIIMV